MLTLKEFSSWHSIKGEVYHDNSKCTKGNDIEEENWRRGTGGKKYCDYCKELAAKAWQSRLSNS